MLKAANIRGDKAGRGIVVVLFGGEGMLEMPVCKKVEVEVYTSNTGVLSLFRGFKAAASFKC